MQKQFTFTRTENLTEYQKLIYDMFEVWGHERFQLLTLLFQAVFTEEDMKRPEYVTSRLVELSHKGYASIRAAPETYDQPSAPTDPGQISEDQPTTEPVEGSQGGAINISSSAFSNYKEQIMMRNTQKGI